MREVEVHHVDLDAGYAPEDWGPAFVRAVLEEAPGRFGALEVSFVAVATDLDLRVPMGGGDSQGEVWGPGHDLLTWLLGRSDGRALGTAMRPFPQLPAWG